jgi:hypothetical protein
MALLDKVKARLKAKYPGVDLSKKRQTAIAARLAKKLNDDSEDSEVDEALETINEITPFIEIKKDDDREAYYKKKLEAASKKGSDEIDEEEEELEEGSPTSKAKKPKTKDDTPAWAKALMERLESVEKKNTAASIAEKINAHPKLQGIPEARRKILLKGKSQPEKDEDIDAFVDGIEADYLEFKQSFVDEGLGQSSATILGQQQNKEGVSLETAQYIAAKTDASKASDLGGKRLE